MQPSQDLDGDPDSKSRIRPRAIIFAALAAALLGLVPLCFFVVDQAEYAVVTEFGEPVQVVTAPGLGLKRPYQSVQKFDSRLFVYTPPQGEFLTLEKTAVVASGAIVWRIAEPRKFFETVFDRTGAEARLSDILFAELGAAIGRTPLDAFVADVPATYRADALRSGAVYAAGRQTLSFERPLHESTPAWCHSPSECSSAAYVA